MGEDVFLVLHTNFSAVGLVYADVEIINGCELEQVRRYMIGEDEVKRMHVNILVDAGSVMLAINENIQEQLQLPVIEKRKVQLANSHIAAYEVVAPPGADRASGPPLFCANKIKIKPC